jgi:hypothetical protein
VCQPAIDSRQQTIYSTQQNADSKQQTVGSRQKTADSRPGRSQTTLYLRALEAVQEEVEEGQAAVDLHLHHPHSVGLRLFALACVNSDRSKNGNNLKNSIKEQIGSIDNGDYSGLFTWDGGF